MDNLQKRQAGHEGRLPGGFAFSLREEDACRVVTPSVLEGLLGRFLTDARRSGTVYTPGFLVRWMAREAVSSWLESRLPSPRSGDEEAGLLGSIRVLDLSVGAGAFTMGMLRELVARRKLLEPDCPEPDLIRAVLEENIYEWMFARRHWRWPVSVFVAHGWPPEERGIYGIACCAGTVWICLRPASGVRVFQR